MSHSQTKKIDGIKAVLAERRKYEQWLTQLEAKRASTPAHVYAKVHGDYELRLAEAQKKLAAETGAVQALVAKLHESLATQEGLTSAKSDERAEAELRAAVGEYSDDEWKTLVASLDEAIGGFSAERDRLRAELETLEKILAEAALPPPMAPPMATPRISEPTAEIAGVASPMPDAGPSAKAPRAPVAADPSPDLPAEPTATPADVDELAFLRSVLGRNTPFGGAAAAQAPDAAKPVPPDAAPIVESPARPSVGRSSGGMSRASSSGINGGAGTTRPSTSEQFAIPEPPLAMPSDQARESAAFQASGTFAVPTPLSAEAVKSLKCGECGALNYPTEWYCERCGGELAAF